MMSMGIFEANKRVETNLDGIQEGEIDLHGSYLRDDYGLCRREYNISQVCGTIGHISSQERIGNAVDTYKDDPTKELKHTRVRVSWQTGHTITSNLSILCHGPRPKRYRPIHGVVPT